MTKYMFDTNAFNKALDEGATLSSNNEYFATHVQRDELSATANQEKRDNLLNTFKLIISSTTPTESSIWGVSKWDECKWSDENEKGGSIIPTDSFILDVSRMDMAKLGDGNLYQEIKDRLDDVNKKKDNNIQDALIGETSIKNNMTLVTDDEDLRLIVLKLGGRAISFEEMISIK